MNSSRLWAVSSASPPPGSASTFLRFESVPDASSNRQSRSSADSTPRNQTTLSSTVQARVSASVSVPATFVSACDFRSRSVEPGGVVFREVERRAVSRETAHVAAVRSQGILSLRAPDLPLPRSIGTEEHFAPVGGEHGCQIVPGRSRDGLGRSPRQKNIAAAPARAARIALATRRPLVERRLVVPDEIGWSRINCRARIRSRALCHRSSGSLARQVATIRSRMAGVSGRTDERASSGGPSSWSSGRPGVLPAALPWRSWERWSAARPTASRSWASP